ncbi:hypothetical protein Enr17x_38680 [Gimesia fumaroli]|uniref:Uncharacterized protein n=1 Tax=Gimesia fumaroli TaxID=2527976 RepID=A0A518IFE4_9PLAN|nr:hypothetical protein Enr17x_38680 [Gimesia fumaroli]
MTNHYIRQFALLLILTISLWPSHWTHTHQGLSGQQLARHLQLYHSNTPPSQLPQGWHCHSDWPFAVTENEIAPKIQPNQPVTSDTDHTGLIFVFNPIQKPGKISDQTSSLFEGICSQQTYLFLNMLLI